MRVLFLFDLLFVMAALWIAVNVLHAVFHMRDKTVRKGFFFLSNFIRGRVK